jgi:hypothetical protein
MSAFHKSGRAPQPPARTARLSRRNAKSLQGGQIIFLIGRIQVSVGNS